MLKNFEGELGWTSDEFAAILLKLKDNRYLEGGSNLDHSEWLHLCLYWKTRLLKWKIICSTKLTHSTVFRRTGLVDRWVRRLLSGGRPANVIQSDEMHFKSAMKRVDALRVGFDDLTRGITTAFTYTQSHSHTSSREQSSLRSDLGGKISSTHTHGSLRKTHSERKEHELSAAFIYKPAREQNNRQKTKTINQVKVLA